MPWQFSFAGPALDGGHDGIGDVLVDVLVLRHDLGLVPFVQILLPYTRARQESTGT